MSECPDCNAATAHVWHGGYRSECNGCTARAIARSLSAFNALHDAGTGDREALRQMVITLMPGVELNRARQMVWEWWQRDHAEARPQAT